MNSGKRILKQKMDKMKLRRKLKRVDVQVSLLVVLTVVMCTCCVYFVGYQLTYLDMIKSLEDRVYAIHDFLDDMLNKDTFRTINTREDMETEEYQEAKKLLESVKRSTEVMYLYTAKKNAEGDFVYCVDGLSQDEDFRYPGDAIEPEIVEDMQRALNGETVLPQGIKNTDWGKIFITYFPIHDGNKVVGVLGIEFEAGHQYMTYRNLKFAIPVVILITSLLATMAAMLVFRRISNPTYQDLYNTDQLTNLKNRNAFETDIHNLNAARKKGRIGIIEADLNNLKKVNDRLGHGAGDLYIQAAGNAMREAVPPEGVVYRMGGDEFAAILSDTSEQEMEELMRVISEKVMLHSEELADKDKGIGLSISIGCALYQPGSGEDLMSVYDRADAEMYEHKKAFHKKSDLDRTEKKS